MGVVMVLTTAGSEEQAAMLARTLVEAGLAACVHIDPIRSIYRWEGELHDEPEWRLTAKTTSDRYEAVERHIRERHSYDTPEILRVDTEGGSAEYLRWVHETLSDEV